MKRERKREREEVCVLCVRVCGREEGVKEQREWDEAEVADRVDRRYYDSCAQSRSSVAVH